VVDCLFRSASLLRRADSVTISGLRLGDGFLWNKPCSFALTSDLSHCPTMIRDCLILATLIGGSTLSFALLVLALFWR
jgi:hypothetical protein